MIGGARERAAHDAMRYMQLPPEGQQRILEQLTSMPAFLVDRFGGLNERQARERGEGDLTSPVEQVWHLADLEREGFGVRIERLLNEDDAQLPDFDGSAVAERRNYRRKSLVEGMRAFSRARQDNIDALQRVTPADWTRRGEQEGVGPVTLGDIPIMMAEHDASHRKEIYAWSASIARQAGGR